MLIVTVTAVACGKKTEHKAVLVEAKAATCTETGNERYYKCDHCGKLYSDEAMQNEIAFSDVSIPAKGHTFTEESHHEANTPTCTEDGNFEYWHCDVCGKDYADPQGLGELEDVTDYASHSLVHLSEKQPTLDDEGKLESWRCSVCEKLFADSKGKTETTAEELVLAKLPAFDVALSAVVKDKAGVAVSADTLSDMRLSFTLTGKTFEKEYDGVTVDSDGKLSLTKMGAGTYKVRATGAGAKYCETEIAVQESETEQAIAVNVDELKHTVVDNGEYVYGLRKSDGKQSFVLNRGGFFDIEQLEDYPAVRIADTNLIADGFMATFTLRSDDFTYPNEWYSRWYISCAPKNGTNQTGYSFVRDQIDIALSSFTFNESSRELSDGYKYYSAWASSINSDLESENGLPFRIIRIGKEVSYEMYTAGEWVLIGTFTLYDDADANLTFRATGPTAMEFGNFDVAKYVARVEPTVTKTGMEAHFISGDRYYKLTGESTTAEALTLAPVVEYDVSLSLQLKHESTQLTLPGDLSLTLSFASSGISYPNVTYSNGAFSVNKMAAGTYTVTDTNGTYGEGTLTVPEDGGDATVVLYTKQYSVDKNFDYVTVTRDENEKAVYLFTQPWKNADDRPTVSFIDENLKNNKYTVEFTLKASLNGTGGYEYSGGWDSRLWIAVAPITGNKHVGFGMLRINGNTIGSTQLMLLRYNGSGDGAGGATELAGQSGYYDAAQLVAAIGSTNGARLKVVRYNRQVTFLAKIGGDWQTVYSFLLDEGLASGFSISANGPHWFTVSDVTVSEVAAELSQDAYFVTTPQADKIAVNGTTKEITFAAFTGAAPSLYLFDERFADNYVAAFTLKASSLDNLVVNLGLAYGDSAALVSSASDALKTQLISTDGLKVHVMRKGSAVKVFAYNGSEWTLLRTFTLSGVCELSFSTNGAASVTLSPLTFGSYSAAKQPDVGVAGNVEYFAVGEGQSVRYYGFDGQEIADVTVPALLDISVTVTKFGVAATADEIAKIVLTLTDKDDSANVIEGTINANGKLVVGKALEKGKTYTVTNNRNYDMAELVISNYTVTLTLTMPNWYTTNKTEGLTVGADNKSFTVNDAWGEGNTKAETGNFPVVNLIDDDLINNHYAVEFTLKLDTAGVDYYYYTSRFYIALSSARTDGAQIGFGAIITGEQYNQIYAVKRSTDVLLIDTDVSAGALDNTGNLLSAIVSTSGVRLRVVRYDSAVAVMAKLGNAWQPIYKFTFPKNADNRFAFGAIGPCMFRVSDISVSDCTVVNKEGVTVIMNIPWSNAWGENPIPEVYRVEDGAVTGTSYDAEFMLKASDLPQSDWTSRFYVSVAQTDGSAVGCGLIITKGGIFRAFADGATGGVAGGDTSQIDSGVASAMLTAIQSESGLRMRISRKDGYVLLSAFVNNEWVGIVDVKNLADANVGAKLCFYGVGATYTVSNITVMNTAQ